MRCFKEYFEFIPSLRLIVTNKCNGKCVFCHKEGFGAEGDMSIEIIKECIIIANDLELPQICITGGEPSLRSDLPDILNIIGADYNGNIVLTSNGANLLKCSDKIISPIYKLNISITSLNKQISREYQNVDPSIIISIINNFPALHKNLNLVAVQDNYDDLYNIVDFCIGNGVSLDIMSELKDYNINELEKYKDAINKLKFDYTPYIDIVNTPKLVIFDDGKCKICLKHPQITSIYIREICEKCPNKCYEKACAIRVYPDLKVSPCLNNNYIFDDGSIRNRITSAYNFVLNRR